ncbi:MAG: PEP-utilizing enzyme [Candidatus Woesearchaeota archaeon]
MKWELIAERKNDFLKNCLVYEAMTNEFVERFGIKHPDYLTIRDGMSYSHFWRNEISSELDKFIKNNLEQDHYFMHKILEEGKEKFGDLIEFSNSLKNLNKRSRIELLHLIKKYFFLYKQAYPTFLISVDSRGIEDDKSIFVKEVVDIMANMRLLGRSKFNETHEIAEPLFKEIANRLKITVNDLKFLTPKEVEQVIKGYKIDIDKKVRERQKCVFILANGQYSMHENASLILHYLENEVYSSELKGQGTFDARYQGIVKHIKTREDMNKINQGDVLVTQMTTTDLITPNLKKAGAIITDEGGVTCHAAILSREYKIPALIGTKFATKVLKDNDLVLIDTKQGFAKKIE